MFGFCEIKADYTKATAVFLRETIGFISKLLNVDKRGKVYITFFTIDFWVKIL
jgi:hypothetical protein